MGRVGGCPSGPFHKVLLSVTVICSARVSPLRQATSPDTPEQVNPGGWFGNWEGQELWDSGCSAPESLAGVLRGRGDRFIKSSCTGGPILLSAQSSVNADRQP